MKVVLERKGVKLYDDAPVGVSLERIPQRGRIVDFKKPIQVSGVSGLLREVDVVRGEVAVRFDGRRNARYHSG